MLGAWVGWDKLTQVMLLPRIPAGPLARYVVARSRAAAMH